MIDDSEHARMAYARRKQKQWHPVDEPTEPTSAAQRQEAEFERRRGEALKRSRRQARLKPYKLLAVQLAGGKVNKP
jgi:hypothetical protein